MNKSLRNLAKLKQQAATLEKLIAAEQALLRGLPGKFGYKLEPFIAALREAASFEGPAAEADKAPARGTPIKAKRRKRAVITDATRAQLKILVEAGKTGPEIAEELHISGASVQVIKKQLGLVKTSKGTKPGAKRRAGPKK